ncbi:xanthine dehydrogenase family protein subunit M [Nonomuraea antimicrobica]|uniref:Xanthine dehydrogenase family protein subunit M n=1 Tax=Nonomuraea antimicrobica TaxID=561173 RepID=A0ABP7EKL7_9ACTN
MRTFEFSAPETVDAAVAHGRAGATFLAGGTTLVDLMKLEVLTPQRVVDINALPLRGIRAEGTGIRIGALERMADVAAHPLVRRRFPVVSQALLDGASQQLRNMASIGGNLLQRTRCGYFRDPASACNRRVPGSGCPAIDGSNRMHAILGTSDSCVATHPSDLAVALVALDTWVTLRAADRERVIRLADLYRLPGDTPQALFTLEPGELITDVVIPGLPWAGNSAYLKIRDRQSYEFALASAAVALRTEHGVIKDARIAVGGMGTVPWRLPKVEDALRGKPSGRPAFEAAAERAAEGARTLADNTFKPTLLKRTIVRALLELEG